MRKEQLLLLALLAAFFRPSCSQDHLEYDEIDDDCLVKTSIVLKKLDTCDSQKIKDDFRRNQLWTDVLDVAMKQAHDDKLELKSLLDRTLLSVEANKKQMEDLMMKVQSIKDCQRTLATWPLIDRNVTMFFKAMGRTFYYNETQTERTWYESRDWCSSRGMHLATLKTAEELEQVANTLKSKIRSLWFWVSASDIGRPPGQFHWADGTPVLNSIWAGGEPNSYTANQEVHTCAQIHTTYEKLWDWSCSRKCSTFCEVPELLATCI